MSDLDKILNGTYNKKKKTDLDAILSGTYEMPKEPPKMEYNLPPRYNSTWDRTKSSLQNTGYLLGRGALKSIEGTMDWANKMSDKVDYGWRKALFGQDYAEQQRNQTRDFIKTDYTQKVGDKTGISNKIVENERKGSIIKRNNLGGQLAEAVGGQLPTLVVSGLAGVGKANALLESAKGLSKGAKFGATALINALPNAMLASRSYGGALEEALNEGATDEEAERYAIGSTAVEIASEWVTGGIPGTNGKGGLDYFADKGIDKISNALVKDLTKFGYKIVGEGAEEGISEIISPFLKNATYSEGNKIDWKSVINSAIIGGLSAGIIDAPTNIQQLKFDINNSINNGSNQLNTEDIRLPKPNEVPKVETVENIVDKPSIQETTVEELATDKPLKFQYETSENPKINEFNESASKYFDNSEKTKQMSDAMTKIIEDKNFKVLFDDKITNPNGRPVNAKITRNDATGELEIRINPNNPRAVEFLMVHEITHAIETESMKNLVMDYASKNEGFNEALESLKQTYGTNDVSDEVLADISGQLFGNQEFINNLSMEKPNIFKRIYNKIIEIANKITGNSNEALFIRDLKQKWEAAYRNVNSNVKNDVQFSYAEDVKDNVKALKEHKKRMDEMADKLQKEGNKDWIYYANESLKTEELINKAIAKGNNEQYSQQEKDLLAIHNLSSDKMKGILELGGFPVPSIAITKSNLGHDQFGDISVIFDKSTIDPSNPQNEVYDRDVWSPTFPETKEKLVESTVKELAKELGTSESYIESTFDGITKEKAVNRLAHEKKLLNNFIERNDLKYEKEYKEVSLNKNYNSYSKMREFIKENDITFDKLVENENLRKQYLELVKESYGDNPFKGMIQRKLETIETMLKENNRMAKHDFDEDFENIKKGLKKELDESKTNENKLNVALKNGYSNYINKIIDKLYGEKYVRNNNDYYSKRGIPRKFNQLYDEYNLDNITKILTDQKTVSTQQGFGAGSNFGTLQANLNNRFNSIEDIKDNKGKIKGGIELSSELEHYNRLFSEDVDILKPYYGGNYLYSSDSAGEALNEFSKLKSLSKSNLQKKLSENQFEEIPNSILEKIVEHIKSLKDIPTDYFEAKPQRAVRFDEVKAIVVPSTLDAELKNQLTEQGMKIVEYNPKIEGDRQKKLDNLNELKFSQQNGTWQEHLEKNYKATGTRTFTKDIINEVEETITKPKGNLTLEETKELEVLNTMDDAFGLEPQEEKRKNDLIKKRDNSIKYPELKEKITFDDIKKQYSKYKDLSGFNEKLLNTAKSFVPGYGKTGRRTKTEWLQVANAIGSNFKGNSEALEKYAIQSWFKSKPNMKENLNRQGQSYVKFSIDEWVNEVYKGAGVGEIIKKVNLPTKEIKKVQETPKETTKILPTTNKTLNPIEISNLTKEDASSTPKLPTIKVKTGEGKSKFAKNIETKTNMLTKESKQNILASDEVTTYEKTTNKADMEKAKAKLDKGGKNEVINWLAKDTKKATSTDVAEGWILLKRYQDEAIKAKDAVTKDEMNRAMVQVAKKMKAMGRSAGQTVQAFNIMNRLTPEGMVYYAQSELDEAFDIMKKNKTKEWIDENSKGFELTPEETQFIMNNVEEASKLPKNSYEKKVKLAEIQKVMTDKLPPEKGAGIKAWMRISMLFNPKTQVRNVLGNAVILPVNVIGDKFSSMVDKQIAKITGVRTKGSSLKGYGHEWVKGVDQSISEGKKGISTRDIEGNRFEIGEGKSFNDNTKVGKALNRVDNILSTMLDAGDRGFYNATFETSLRNQMVLNHTTEVTPEMIAIATNEALSRTWQDNNNYTKFVLNVRRMLNGDKAYGVGDILIPFAKTPANLTKAIVDYSPAGLISSIKKGINLKRSLNNGQFTPQLQHEFVDSLGKATAGTMLYVLGTALAQAGITSGDNDKDKDVSNFMRNVLGKNSYSITIGGKSYSYSWAQPLAAPLSITANIVNKKKEDANFIEKTLSSLNIAGDILLEQSFMDSINTVLNNRDGFFTGLEEAILDLPARAIPTLFKQIADIVDPQQRTSFEYDKPLKTLLNKIKSKLPIASKELTTSYDTLGRPIMKYGGKNNLFNVFLNPANIATENISKSGEEIYRLYKETGDKTIMPRVAPYYINQKGEKINLSTKEKSEFQKISGGIIESEVDKLMQNEIYKNATDEEKAEYVKEIVDYSYNLAREEIVKIPMSQSYKKINQYVRDGGSPSDYYTHKEEINYAYENPTRYATIRQITDYDKYTSYKKELDTIRDNSQDKRSATIKYINSLNLSIPKKAMLIKTYYKSFKNYDKQIIKYINSQDISVEEKTAILKDLGFTVRNGRVY